MKGFLHDTWLTRQEDESLTPPGILRSLGPFDLDPCAPVDRPWDTARHHYTIHDDGSAKPWFGRVWMNPPYGRQTPIWMERLRRHANGVALIFARTETRSFFDFIWGYADAILFLKGRIGFYRPDGTAGGHAGAPSCLVAYGRNNVTAFQEVVCPGL